MQLSQRVAVLVPVNVRRFSPWVLGSQFLLCGEKFNAVLQLEESLLLRLVLHALMLVKVLLPHTNELLRQLVSQSSLGSY